LRLVLFHVKTITATMTGRVVRDVKCENCGCEYVYFVRLRATASASTPMSIGQEGTRAVAQGRAKLRLKELLRSGFLAIPCPDCGWYQKYMVQILRRRRLFWWILLAVLPLVWIGLEWVFSSPDEPTDFHLPILFGLSAGLAVAGIILHHLWQDNRDPAAHLARDPTSRGIAMRKADFEKLKATPPTAVPSK
jgi:ribosomal protein S27E